MKKLNKNKALAVLICLVLFLVGCTAKDTQTSAPAETTAVYTASGEGKNGPVTIKVTFEGSKIAEVLVTEHQETEGVATPALERIPAAIVEQQSVAVDAISGATITSNAIIEAVKSCINQAGLNIKDYSAKLAKQYSSQELSTDVLVIGGGGAGLTAAIEAANQGADVILLEKLSTVGGSTKLSEGMVIRGAKEGESQKALTADELYQLYVNYGKDNKYFKEPMVRDFTRNLESNMDWLLEKGFIAQPYLYQGWVPLDPSNSQNADNISYIVMVNGKPEGGKGYYLTSALEKAALDAGVKIMTNTAGTELITNDQKEVIGAKARSSDNTEYTIWAKAVVLACGGFGGSKDIMAEYTALSPYESLGGYVGSVGNTGDGITMAKAVGAATALYFTDLSAVPDVTYTTTGGVIINEKAQVLDENGNPIPRLYAAGEMTNVALMGSKYTACGTYNAWSVYTGRLAGKFAAAEK